MAYILLLSGLVLHHRDKHDKSQQLFVAAGIGDRIGFITFGQLAPHCRKRLFCFVKCALRSTSRCQSPACFHFGMSRPRSLPVSACLVPCTCKQVFISWLESLANGHDAALVWPHSMPHHFESSIFFAPAAPIPRSVIVPGHICFRRVRGGLGWRALSLLAHFATGIEFNRCPPTLTGQHASLRFSDPYVPTCMRVWARVCHVVCIALCVVRPTS